MGKNTITGYILKFGHQSNGDFIPKDCKISIGSKITDWEIDENGVRVIKDWEIESINLIPPEHEIKIVKE